MIECIFPIQSIPILTTHRCFLHQPESEELTELLAAVMTFMKFAVENLPQQPSISLLLDNNNNPSENTTNNNAANNNESNALDKEEGKKRQIQIQMFITKYLPNIVKAVMKRR